MKNKTIYIGILLIVLFFEVTRSLLPFFALAVDITNVYFFATIEQTLSPVYQHVSQFFSLMVVTVSQLLLTTKSNLF